MNTPPWYYRLRFTNWLIARPWLVYPLSKKGWRYRALYATFREHGDYPDGPKSRPWCLWQTVIFPHVHHSSEDSLPWKPDWELPPVPCEHPDTCGPQQPTCETCLAGKKAFLAEHPNSDWAALKEWHREAWRREAADV